MAEATTQRSRATVIVVLGIGQVLVWGTSYYLLAVLAKPIAHRTGWPLSWIIGALSLSLLVSGLVSPKVGRLIDQRGGRPVMVVGAALMAVGLLILAISPGLIVFTLGWLVLGVAMGAGLYDPAFATLGRLYGKGARTAITSLTLIGGFASTICWPLSALLLAHAGWRGTCVAYAAVNLLVVLPLYRYGLPREAPAPSNAPAEARCAEDQAVPLPRSLRYRLLFTLVALSNTFASIIASMISVHLLTLLQLRGVSLSEAVAFGTLVGPCQVGARLIDLMLGQRIHPIWETMLSAILVVLGLGLLWTGYGPIAAGLVLYGFGIGLRSIVRGSLPLVLFGPTGYASLMGRLAFPMLLGQAVAPSAGAVLLDHFGGSGVLAALMSMAIATLASAVLLVPFLQPRAPTAPATL